MAHVEGAVPDSAALVLVLATAEVAESPAKSIDITTKGKKVAYLCCWRAAFVVWEMIS